MLHHALVYMGDLQLIHRALNLSTLDGGGLEQFSVSPRPLGFGFGTKGLGPGLDNSSSSQPNTYTQLKLCVQHILAILAPFSYFSYLFLNIVGIIQNLLEPSRTF